MKKSILILVGLFLLIVSVIFDQSIVKNVASYRTSLLNILMLTFSFLGSGFIVFILTTGLFAFDKNKRKYLPALWLTLIIAAVLIVALKYLIARPRPNILPLEIKNNFSFPSGHALAFFAPLALIDKEFPKLKWVWLAIGLLVLISRVYLGVHYMSDVIAGALIGYTLGLLVLLGLKQL